jgi:hypothetical protein
MRNAFSTLRFIFTFLAVSIILFACREIPQSYEKIKKAKRTNGRMTDFLASLEYELNLLKDPKTGRIPEGIHEKELSQAKEIYRRQSKITSQNYYTFQGPNNMGGRTRTIVFDKRYNGTSNRIILAGGVSGGVFKSTDDGATWIRKSATGDHFSCTSIAQDPRPGFENTWYYATGEAAGNSASGTGAFYGGNGVYKSTDNGETWFRLVNSNTTPLESFSTGADFINKIVVNPVNGHVYMACLAAIMRSQDGGNTWATVLSGSLVSSGQVTDIVVSSTGRLFAAFSGLNNSTVDGVWVSETGNTGSWNKIAGTGAESNPAGWKAQGAYSRIVLALAPSNENILYALYGNGQTYPSLEADLFRYNYATASWTNLSANLPDEPGGSPGNDPFAVQGGYNLVVAVKPDDANVVFIGGTNIYRSTNGFTSTANTVRIGGYVNANSYGMYANSHPDIHAIEFQPGNPSVLICGNDGGIQRTSNCLANTVSWTPINTGYRTFQYYYVAVDPRLGNNKAIGGAQDNGSTRNISGSGSDMEMVLGGDGVAVGLSNPIGGETYEYVGWQYGQIIRRGASLPSGFGSSIRPGVATQNGLFITVFHLDPDNTENLYYLNSNRLFRNTSASTATTSNWTEMTGTATAANGNFLTALATTRGSYNSSTASLFIGTNTSKVFRLDDPVNATAGTVPVDISAGLPLSGYISSIAVNPRNDDTVLVTLSNYGINNLWWTGNANSANPTWLNVEGNLTLPSVRSSAIAITPDGVQYFAGTSVGLYRSYINASNPGTTSWTQEGSSELGNAVVTSLSLRPSDNRLLVGTHGYGMWTTTLSYVVLPVNLLNFSGQLLNDRVELNWQATHQSSNGGFDIERSIDGTHFRTIGSVKLAQNALIANKYSFTDFEPATGNNFYRLKIYESSGAGKSSKVVLVKKLLQQKIIVSNPFSNQVELRFDLPPSDLTISIRNAAGKLVHLEERKGTLPASITIRDLNGLAKGVYFLTVNTNGRTYSYKIIKQ